MKLEHLAFKGWSSAFPDAVDLPLAELPDGLIAVVGVNGAGKTAVLEATAAALYQQLPARADLNAAAYAVGRDSYIDLKYSTDAGWFRSKVSFDSQTRKTDGVLEQITERGNIPLNDGKISTYKTAIAARFPSYDLFINSSFAAQGRGDQFARTGGSKRKDLFAEFLGLRRWLAMAETATRAAALAHETVVALGARFEALREQTNPKAFQAVRDARAALERDLAEAGAQRLEVQAQVAALEAREQLAGDQVAAYAHATHRVAQAATAVQQREGEREALVRAYERDRIAREQERDSLEHAFEQVRADIAQRIAGNQQIQGQATDIRAAVLAVSTIDGQLEDARGQETEDQQRRVAATTALAVAESAVAFFTKPEAALERSRRDAKILDTVPCHAAGVYATCEFLTLATRAQLEIADLERHLAGLQDAVARRDGCRQDLADIDERLAYHRRTLQRLQADRAAHAKVAGYEKALLEGETRVSELRTKEAEVVAQADKQRAGLTARQEAARTSYEVALAAIDQVLAHLATESTAAAQAIQDAANGNTEAVAVRTGLRTAREAWDRLTAAQATGQAGLEELDRCQAALVAAAREAQTINARLSSVLDEEQEWRDLAKALGKGGLPDLEIDAAGPGISAATNEILLASFGPRFTIELVTQVVKADGSGMKDEFTVRVWDNEAGGEWRDLSEPSGGEKVIIQEALMSAIAIYVAARSPMPIRTLFRDETGAALDRENAVRYVAMLRKVRELGGFHQVYYISHNAEAAARADAQIRVGGGAARIVLPPYEAA